MAQEGKNEEEIAKGLGISRATHCRWKKRFAKYGAALQMDKAAAPGELESGEIESALLKRAMGYEYEEVEETLDGEGAVVMRKIRHRTVAPNTAALKFWLKSRQPGRWGEVTEDDRDGPGEVRQLLDLSRELHGIKPTDEKADPDDN